MLKPYIQFNTQKRIGAEKNNDKDGKALQKLVKNVVYRKTMESFRNRINVNVQQNQAASRAKYLTIIYSRYVEATCTKI